MDKWKAREFTDLLVWSSGQASEKLVAIRQQFQTSVSQMILKASQLNRLLQRSAFASELGKSIRASR